MSLEHRTSDRRQLAFACLLLACATIALYAPVAGFEFVSFDDDRCVIAHPVVSRGLAWDAVVAAITGPLCANWTPLAWLSHMLDIELYGFDATGPHLTNLALHVANTILLLAALYSATHALFRSALVAALFAAHPLHVESVAWVAERRDVLSGAFGLAAVWTYVRWTQTRRPRDYAATFVCLLLGLLSKAMLVTLPLWLVLLDYWPLRRLTLDSGALRSAWARLREKWPLFALTAAFCIATVLAQRGGGAMPTSDALPLAARVGNALVSYVIYLAKTIRPFDLAIFYPHPELPGGPEPWSAAQIAGAAALLLAITFAAWRLRSTRGYLLVGWLWFAIGLVPVIGLVQVGQAALADRYTYLPLIGVFVAAVFGVSDLVTPPRASRGALPRAAAAAALALVLALSAASWRQIGYWRDSFTLFEHATRVTRGNFTLHYNLANLYKQRGDVARAEHHYEQAIAAHPAMVRAHFNFANMLRDQQRLDEAIEHYTQAASYSQDDLRALTQLVVTARVRDGNDAASIAWLRQTIDLEPERVDLRVALGDLLLAGGERDEAVEAYRSALERQPDSVEIRQRHEDALAGG